MFTGLEHLPLGILKREQHTAANVRCIFDCLQPWRDLRPFLVSEVAVRGSGGDDQVVVCHDRSAGQRYLPRSRVDREHLVHHHFGIAILVQNRADGLGNVARRKHRKRHLVQQRLKGVMILPINDGDVDRQFAEPLGGRDPGKSRTDNHDSRSFAVWICSRHLGPASVALSFVKSLAILDAVLARMDILFSFMPAIESHDSPVSS